MLATRRDSDNEDTSETPKKSPRLRRTGGRISRRSSSNNLQNDGSNTESSPTTPVADLTTLTILLVDDTFVNCLMLLKIFGYSTAENQSISSIHASGAGKLPPKRKNLEIYLANDGSTALEYVTTHNLVMDYVISDYNMPNMHGDKLILKMHKDHLCRQEYMLLTADEKPVMDAINKQMKDASILNVTLFHRSEIPSIMAKTRAIASGSTKPGIANK